MPKGTISRQALKHYFVTSEGLKTKIKENTTILSRTEKVMQREVILVVMRFRFGLSWSEVLFYLIEGSLWLSHLSTARIFSVLPYLS